MLREGHLMLFPWYASMMLAIDSNGVIALRMTTLAFGGTAANREAVLMVQEKVAASIEAGVTLLSGGSAGSVVDRYREHVQANSARLLAG